MSKFLKFFSGYRQLEVETQPTWVLYLREKQQKVLKFFVF